MSASPGSWDEPHGGGQRWNEYIIYTVPISHPPFSNGLLASVFFTGDKGALCLPCYSIKRPHGWLDIFEDVWSLSRESIPPNVWQILWSNLILEIPQPVCCGKLPQFPKKRVFFLPGGFSPTWQQHSSDCGVVYSMGCQQNHHES